MRTITFNKNYLFILLADAFLLVAATYAAYLVRFDFDIPERHWLLLKRLLPLALAIKMVTFYFLGLYKGMWRYTSIADLFNIIKAASLSSLLIIGIILLGTRFEGFSRSVFVIDWCFTIVFISTFRLLIRIYFVHLSESENWPSTFMKFWVLFKRNHPNKKKLLIIGAGDCGEKIYREIRDNLNLKYNVVGFLDDDPSKTGKKIHGVPILSPIKEIKTTAQKTGAHELLIAISSATSTQMRSIIDNCNASGLPSKTIPGMGELINGKVTVSAIRDVAYRDLLGRDVVNLEEKEIGEYLKGQVVLVTGAGGSIGSELCRQISRFQPESIILFERAESPLYDIELELKRNFSEVNVVPLLADIQDRQELEKTFRGHKPHVVFHAAAYKHVPMLEMQPWRAVENNIYGTLNVVEVAKQFNVPRFVFVSTDKAVRPTNVMGASKRVAEMLIQGQNDCKPMGIRYMIVRFGNVVGSVGSVVPLFKNQIKNGGPLTVTHPEVTRFFMTIPEACQLILQAGTMGNKNCVEIYILEMGTPIRIIDMARDLIKLSGFEPDVDIKIEYVGLRPGEKLCEELITQGEGIVSTSHDKIMVLRGEKVSMKLLNGRVEELIQLARYQDGKKIKAKLKEIVPEYTFNDII